MDLNLFYYMQNNEVQGPLSLGQIRQYVESGALPKDVFVCNSQTKEWISLASLDNKPQQSAPPVTYFEAPSSSSSSQMKLKEYKVLSQKDKWFSGKFDPAALEKALNDYARQGWYVAGCASADFPSMLGGARQELVILLEREA